ncbi:MAG: serine hydrolase [Clostridiales bacterium]|nr:serine hydrolase [Clostridiales bacterium]
MRTRIAVWPNELKKLGLSWTFRSAAQAAEVDVNETTINRARLRRKAQHHEAEIPDAGVRLFVILALLAFLLPLLLPSPSFASSPVEKDTAAALLAYLDAANKNWNFQGSVLAARDGDVVLKRGVGLADVKADRLNTPSTRFLVGSITKTFTAAAVLQLEERGLLSLKDPVVKHLSGYPKKTGARMTIHHLLSHTSGVPELAAAPGRLGDLAKPRKPMDLIALFKDRPLDFEPGEKHQYSNSGYVILGAIIEKASGQSYCEYIQGHIFRPLGMKDSGCCEDYNDRPDFARGYVEGRDGKLMPAPYVHPSLGYAAGALHSTVGDMLKWDQALSSNKILSRASLDKMFRPVKDDYGYGWLITRTFGREDVFHGGGTPGFSAWIERWPEEKMFIAVLSNTAGAPAGEIGRSLAAILFGEKYEPPRIRGAIQLSAEVLEDYVGVYKIDAENFRVISREDGSLFVARNDGRRFPILPFARDEFFFPTDKGASLRFTRDKSGRIDGQVFHQLGVDEKAVKLSQAEAKK